MSARSAIPPTGWSSRPSRGRRCAAGASGRATSSPARSGPGPDLVTRGASPPRAAGMPQVAIGGGVPRGPARHRSRSAFQSGRTMARSFHGRTRQQHQGSERSCPASIDSDSARVRTDTSPGGDSTAGSQSRFTMSSWAWNRTHPIPPPLRKPRYRIPRPAFPACPGSRYRTSSVTTCDGTCPTSSRLSFATGRRAREIEMERVQEADGGTFGGAASWSRMLGTPRRSTRPVRFRSRVVRAAIPASAGPQSPRTYARRSPPARCLRRTLRTASSRRPGPSGLRIARHRSAQALSPPASETGVVRVHRSARETAPCQPPARKTGPCRGTGSEPVRHLRGGRRFSEPATILRSRRERREANAMSREADEFRPTPGPHFLPCRGAGVLVHPGSLRELGRQLVSSPLASRVPLGGDFLRQFAAIHRWQQAAASARPMPDSVCRVPAVRLDPFAHAPRKSVQVHRAGPLPRFPATGAPVFGRVLFDGLRRGPFVAAAGTRR